MRVMTGCALVLGAAMTMGTGWAQGTAPGSPGANGGAHDAMFAKMAIKGSQAEIDGAQMALQKSSNPQVQDLAHTLINDHTKLLQEMEEAAKAEGIAYTDKPSAKAQAMLAKLDKTSGSDFDRAYVSAMVKDHKADVRAFQQEIRTGKDEQVKDLAEKGLPVIEHHLEMVEALEKSLNPPV